MDNSKQKTNWVHVLAPAALTFALTLTVPILLDFLSMPNLSVDVSSSVLDGNQYTTIVTIENSSETVYHDVDLYLTNNVVTFVHTLEEVQFSDNSILIQEILPESSSVLMVKSEGLIDKEHFFVDEEYSANINFPFGGMRLYILGLLFACIQFVIVAVSLYFSDKMLSKRMYASDLRWDEKQRALIMKCDEISEAIAQKTTENAELNEQIEQISADIDSQKEEAKVQLRDARLLSKRLTIYYQLRNSELQKELSFWRNTLRKVLYSKEQNFIVADSIIETVTEELKTYTTREKGQTDIDKEFYIARMITEGSTFADIDT